MTINHHPSDELLLDYATGALGEAWSLAIATHLAFCPKCRSTKTHLEAIGGAFVAGAPETALSSAVFDNIMNRLDDEPAVAIEVLAPQDATDLAPILPHPLRQYLGGDVDAISWRRLGLGASQYVIPLADGSAMARMLRIPAGKPVPEHSHNGLELTLVLCGAFADGTGVYGPGDLQEADQSLDHQPHAADGEDCICLAITDAPLRFKSMAARMVQPLLGI